MSAHFDVLRRCPPPDCLPEQHGATWSSEAGSAGYGPFSVRLQSVMQAVKTTRRPTGNATGTALGRTLNADGPLFDTHLTLTSRTLEFTVPQAYTPALATALRAWSDDEPGRLSFCTADAAHVMTVLTAERRGGHLWIARVVWDPRTGAGAAPDIIWVRTPQTGKRASTDALYWKLREQVDTLSTLEAPQGHPPDETFSRADRATYRDLAALMADATLRLKNRGTPCPFPVARMRYQGRPDWPALHQTDLTAGVDGTIAVWTLYDRTGTTFGPDIATQVTLRTVASRPVVRVCHPGDSEILLPEEFTVLLARLLQDVVHHPETAGQVLSYRSRLPLLGLPLSGSDERTREVVHLGQGRVQLRETRHDTHRSTVVTLDAAQTHVLTRLCHRFTQQHLQRLSDQEAS